MQRRGFLSGLLAGAALLICAGHTPYNQWVVYRKRTLLIGSVRSDPATYKLAEQVAAILAEALPKSRARLSRAPNYERLASLLATSQLSVAVLAKEQAKAMAGATSPYEQFDPVPLRALYDLGDYLLVGHADFPAHHAYLVAQTLQESGGSLGGTLPKQQDAAAIQVHQGTGAFARGEPPPEPPLPEDPVGHEHDE